MEQPVWSFRRRVYTERQRDERSGSWVVTDRARFGSPPEAIRGHK